MGARRQLQGVARVRARRTQVRSGPGALLPPLVDDGLRPEHHAEDHEDRPLERVGPAERVAALRPVELPVTEPEHAPAGGDRERVPGQPPGADQETPTRVRLAACHAPSLVRLRPVAVWRITRLSGDAPHLADARVGRRAVEPGFGPGVDVGVAELGGYPLAGEVQLVVVDFYVIDAGQGQPGLG